MPVMVTVEVEMPVRVTVLVPVKPVVVCEVS